MEIFSEITGLWLICNYDWVVQVSVCLDDCHDGYNVG